MANIRTRQINKGTVKSIDRAANLSSHVRNATVRTKEGMRQDAADDGRSASGYASDNSQRAAERTVYEAGHLAAVGARRVGRAYKDRSERAETGTKADVHREGRTRAQRDIRAKAGRQESAAQKKQAVKTSSGGRKIKTSSAADAGKQMQQMKKTEYARKMQQAFRKTGERSARQAKQTARLAFRALKAAIESTKVLVSAIVAGGWIAVIVILICVLFGAAFYVFGDDSSANYTPVSPEVEAYTPLIQKYAGEYGIPEYVDLIKAVMMQESGGRGTDPMQCSESPYNTRYSRAPGSIKDPEYSISCGVHYLADCLNAAKCKNPLDMSRIRLAIQGYNYGNGYIPWAIKRDGGYTVENAAVFSDMQAKKHGWSGYGDKQYAAHVLRYYPYGSYNIGVGNTAIVKVAQQQIGNHGGRKFWSWYGFGSRESWCGCFVSWCADQCGYIKSGTIPKFSYVPSIVDWARSHHQWQSRNYKPAPGDIIVIDWYANGTRDHVGIVEGCDGKTVHTIEGNRTDQVGRGTYSVGSGTIFGYFIPKY